MSSDVDRPLSLIATDGKGLIAAIQPAWRFKSTRPLQHDKMSDLQGTSSGG
ncbi:MAG: hypothetical protein HHJ09_14615 [Glaciimonas sp.]|nr:hypothetical protein [Glaciimonas sp.]